MNTPHVRPILHAGPSPHAPRLDTAELVRKALDRTPDLGTKAFNERVTALRTEKD